MSYDARNFYKKIAVLDKGFMELIDGPREDPRTKIVNAARVSFNRETKELRKKDIGLIKFMNEHGHYSVFRHSHFTFRWKAPLFVFRQAWKYQIDSGWEEDSTIGEVPNGGSIEICSTNWNEASGRYVKFDPEFYIPETIRVQSTDNKQGSEGKLEELPNGADPVEFFEKRCMEQYDAYEFMVKAGAAKEQCRAILPQGIYTQCIWTASLQTLMFFLHQRLKSDAQYEIRQYALAVLELLDPIFSPLELFDRPG